MDNKSKPIDENNKIRVTGHLLIRDKETGRTIVSKRDENVKPPVGDTNGR